MPEIIHDVADEHACTTGNPHAPGLGQPAAAFGDREENACQARIDAFRDANLVNGDEDYMEEDDDDMDDSLDDMESFVPGLHPSWHVSIQAPHCRDWSMSGMLQSQVHAFHS